METVLVAPCAFKGTLGPLEAADALVRGVEEALPDALIIRCPIADGGDGTLAVLLEHLGGERIEQEVTGPDGRPVRAAIGLLPDEVAVVELASASGLALMPEGERDPLRAATRGTGELISAALDHHPRRIIVGAGGSATSDAGAGLLQALGVGFFDARGRQVSPGAEGLVELERIDLTFRDSRLKDVEIVVACDVANPLLGDDGAARTFAPQKGAGPQEVERIERGLERFAEVLMRDFGRWIGETPRTGAAGGAAGGLYALCGAELRAGFEVVAEMVGFDDLLARSTLLIVGEGSLDEQSLAGKAPIAAARRAREAGVPVWAFAGRVALDESILAGEAIEVVQELGGSADPAAALRAACARTLRGAVRPAQYPQKGAKTS